MRVLIPSLVLLAACAETTLTAPVSGGVDASPERGVQVVGLAPPAQVDVPALAANPDIDLHPADDVVEEWQDVPGTPIALAVVVDVGFRAQVDQDRLRQVALAAVHAAGRDPHPQDTLTLVAHTDRVASRLTPALPLAADGAYDALVQVASGLASCSTLRDPAGWADVGYHSFAPQMPPCFGDERGTDLAAALALAGEALDEAPDHAARALIWVGPGRVDPLSAPAAGPERLQLPWPSLQLHDAQASRSELEVAAAEQADDLAADGVAVWTIGVGRDADVGLLRRLSASGRAVISRDLARAEDGARDAVSVLRAAADR